MGTKVHQNIASSSALEVGEIDTSAPFKSVKAAVSMFGKSAFSRYQPAMRKPKSESSGHQKMFAKETQLHLIQKELNRYKKQVESCDTARNTAFGELDKEKRTVVDLTQKLKAVYQSKETATKMTETAKIRSMELEDGFRSQAADSGLWKQELDTATEQYAIATAKLDIAKQDLRRLKKEFETSMDAKVSAIRKQDEVKLLVDINREQAKLLSKDIADVQESIMHVKVAYIRAKEEESKIAFDKDTLWKSYRVALEETKRKLALTNEEFDSDSVEDLERKLAEKTMEIALLQKEVDNARDGELNSITIIKNELDRAKGILNKVEEEENSLRALLESLNLELESVMRNNRELREKDAESESLAGNIHVKLQESKSELEMAVSVASKSKEAMDDLISTLKQLSLESENARKSADMLRTNAEVNVTEVKAARFALHEAKEKLCAALRDLEEAKNAEANARNQIRLLTDRANIAGNSPSASGANVKISQEEFESLRQKGEDSKMLSEIKISAAMAQVEAVKASENEAIKKLEAVCEETKEIESAIEETLKSATMAEAARMAIEGEVKRLREREQKREAVAASQKSPEMAPHKKTSPAKTKAAKPDSMSVRAMMEKTTTARRTIIPYLAGIKFLIKKNHPEGGPPSHVPGEKSV